MVNRLNLRSKTNTGGRTVGLHRSTWSDTDGWAKRYFNKTGRYLQKITMYNVKSAQRDTNTARWL